MKKYLLARLVGAIGYMPSVVIAMIAFDLSPLATAAITVPAVLGYIITLDINEALNLEKRPQGAVDRFEDNPSIIIIRKEH